MSNTTNFTFNQTSLTAQIDLYVDAVLVTTYSIGGGIVTLSPIVTDALLTFESLRNNINSLKQWYDLVSIYILPYSFYPIDYRSTIFEDTNSIDMKFVAHNQDPIHIVYHKVAGDFTVKLRPQLTMSGSEYVVYSKLLNQYIELVTAYQAGKR